MYHLMLACSAVAVMLLATADANALGRRGRSSHRHSYSYSYCCPSAPVWGDAAICCDPGVTNAGLAVATGDAADPGPGVAQLSQQEQTWLTEIIDGLDEEDKTAVGNGFKNATSEERKAYYDRFLLDKPGTPLTDEEKKNLEEITKDATPESKAVTEKGFKDASHNARAEFYKQNKGKE